MTRLIIGAGVSGFGAAKLLRSKGFAVRVSDASKLSDEKRDLFTSLGVEIRDNGHQISDLDDVEELILSPGVGPAHLLVKAAINRSIPIVSEIDLAMANYSGCLIAVTGTNGKSTTCAMIYHLLKKLGLDAGLGGNFGLPPSQILADRGTLPSFLVLELSSYQLEQSRPLAPRVAIFTSFSHDHMARHGSLTSYMRAKWNVFRDMPIKSLAIVPSDIQKIAKGFGLTIDTSTTSIFDDEVEIKSRAPQFIKEPHNRLNAGFAIESVSYVSGKPYSELAPLLADFVGLRHRCELIGEVNQMACINDSKSTNVESTLVALAGQTRPVILLMGGQGKGESFLPVLQHREKIAVVLAFGASGPEIAKDLRASLVVQEFPTLKLALEQITGIIKSFDAPILFSPGCASFDEFRNYEHRGDYFKEQVRPLLDR